MRQVRDAVKEQEGIDEAVQDNQEAAADAADANATDSEARARHAERDAHVRGDKHRREDGGPGRH